MKKRITIYITGLFLVTVSWKVSNDIIEQLGLQESTAQQYILKNIAGDFSNAPIGEAMEDHGGVGNDVEAQMKAFKMPYANMLPQIIAGDKARAAKELCAYVRQFVGSNEFAIAYARSREVARPTSEPYRMDAGAIASLKANLKEMEASLVRMKAAKLPASVVQQMEAGISQQKKVISDQSDPTPNKTLWNKMYPANASDAVKARLQEYLALAATVDFSAATTGSGKKRVFANAVHEKKSLKWKAIYRAGKEVNDIVTAFAKQWLAGEIIAK